MINYRLFFFCLSIAFFFRWLFLTRILLCSPNNFHKELFSETTSLGSWSAAESSREDSNTVPIKNSGPGTAFGCFSELRWKVVPLYPHNDKSLNVRYPRERVCPKCVLYSAETNSSVTYLQEALNHRGK